LRSLRTQYGVSWVLLETSATVGGVVCPYQNGQLRVCRLVDEQRLLLGQSSVAAGVTAIEEVSPPSPPRARSHTRPSSSSRQLRSFNPRHHS
jgi:hypothetical protein